MLCYQIGPLSVSMDTAPESWQPFRTQNAAEPLLRVERTDEPVDLTGWRLMAEHEMMHVWRREELSAGWLFQDSRFHGWLWLSPDGMLARFHTAGAQEGSYALLLQAAAECALIRLGVMILHAACVCVEGEAVAFSGPSGAGKSTRAAQWVKLLGARMLSGDRPAVDPASGIVRGVPWDGKERVFVNAAAPLRAIVEVRRGSCVKLRRMTDREAWSFLAGQLLIPMWDTPLAAKALSGLRRLIARVPIYRLYSDGDEQSALKSYEILFRNPEQIEECEEETKMKLKPGFEIVQIDTDYLALPTGENIAAFAGSVVLNEVSATLLRELSGRECSREDLLELLLNQYKVERDVAAQDLDNILKTFAEIGLTEG